MGLVETRLAIIPGAGMFNCYKLYNLSSFMTEFTFYIGLITVCLQQGQSLAVAQQGDGRGGGQQPSQRHCS